MKVVGSHGMAMVNGSLNIPGRRPHGSYISVKGGGCNSWDPQAIRNDFSRQWTIINLMIMIMIICNHHHIQYRYSQ